MNEDKDEKPHKINFLLNLKQLWDEPKPKESF